MGHNDVVNVNKRPWWGQELRGSHQKVKMWGEGKTGLCVDNSLRMHLDCFLSSCILHFHEGAAAAGSLA